MDVKQAEELVKKIKAMQALPPLERAKAAAKQWREDNDSKGMTPEAALLDVVEASYEWVHSGIEDPQNMADVVQAVADFSMAYPEVDSGQIDAWLTKLFSTPPSFRSYVLANAAHTYVVKFTFSSSDNSTLDGPFASQAEAEAFIASKGAHFKDSSEVLCVNNPARLKRTTTPD